MASHRSRNPRGSGEQLRDDLLRVASELLEKPRMVSAPSLRQIAVATGITPSAVYTRFKSGEELLQAVIDSQYESLRESVREAASSPETAIVKLEQIASRYVHWGIEHPGIYQLLFESADQLPEGLVAHGPGVELLTEIAPLITQHTGCSPDTSHRTTLRLWAALHGITSLRIHKNRAPWSTSVEEEAVATVSAYVSSVR